LRHNQQTQAPAHVPRASAAVASLVDNDLLEPRHAVQAQRLVEAALGERHPGRPTVPTPLRGRLAEVAGYVGGSLVVAAAAVFVAERWAGLSIAGQVVTLAAIALVLLGSAVTIVLTAGRPLRERTQDVGVRRRLASVLACGGAVAAEFAAWVLVDDIARQAPSMPWFAGGTALAAVALGGYLLAPSALGQITVALGAGQAVGSGLDLLVPAGGEVSVALALVALGVVWLALTERDVWGERTYGLVIGCLFLLLGGQVPALTDHRPLGYLLTAAVAVATVSLYVRTRAVPYLGTAVAALTLAVPEALFDLTDGSLGPVGVLFVSGVTLLVAGLLGLRLRREVGDEQDGQPDNRAARPPRAP
jgi:hypothetical protein